MVEVLDNKVKQKEYCEMRFNWEIGIIIILTYGCITQESKDWDKKKRKNNKQS